METGSNQRQQQSEITALQADVSNTKDKVSRLQQDVTKTKSDHHNKIVGLQKDLSATKVEQKKFVSSLEKDMSKTKSDMTDLRAKIDTNNTNLQDKVRPNCNHISHTKLI